MPRSTVIIPAYNHADLTDACLARVLESGAAEVIVVDDASADDTPARLARYGDRIRVLRQPENLGFARACNAGAAAARGEFLVFLNNDTLPESGWLAALERHADAHPAASAIGAKLLYPDDTIQHAGVVIGQDRYPRHLYAGFPAAHPAVCRSRRFQIVTAACMLVRRAVFAEAEGFDPGYRNGFEDVDFCLRLGARGHEIHYCAESVVYHLESVSPGRFKHRRENVERYRARWFDRVRPDDLGFYAEDGLLRLTYEGRYPIGIEVSPLLATLDDAARAADVERALRERTRQVADLQRENTRLRLDLGARAEDAPELRYQQLRAAVRACVERAVPAGAVVAVASNGDGGLLEWSGRTGWHFPREPGGAYAGHHPANSADARARLEDLRRQGATHFLIPAPSLWWLDHYAGFARHLEEEAERLPEGDEVGALYALRPRTEPPP